jgi:predicted nucleic acid-binding protein
VAAGAAREPLPYDGQSLVVDTSAWTAVARLEHKSPGHPLIGTFEQALASGLLRGCHMVDLELRHYAAGSDVPAVTEKLEQLPAFPITSQASYAAVRAQWDLAERSTPGFPGYHRVGHGDYLIAATAWHAGYGVLHFNKDFDRMEEVLGTPSVWVFPKGLFAQIDGAQ